MEVLWRIVPAVVALRVAMASALWFDPLGAEDGWVLLSAGSLRSPAVIEKFDRFAAARLSEASWGGGAVAHRACGGSVACGGWFFNTENRLFSRACSLACIYAKIRNA